MCNWLASLVLCFVSVSAVAHSARRAQHSSPDPDYSVALAAANRFLHAWQTQDHETGIMMLSDTARQQVSQEQLQDFFSPSGIPAFEIEHGYKVSARAFAFPVKLFGFSGTLHRARAGKILIGKTGKDEWSVEKLP